MHGLGGRKCKEGEKEEEEVKNKIKHGRRESHASHVGYNSCLHDFDFNEPWTCSE